MTLVISHHTAQASLNVTLMEPPANESLGLIDFAIQAGSHSAFRRKAHTLAKGRVHLLSSLSAVLPVFSQRDTRWTSAPFRAGQILNPYPPHYRMAFASSSISSPHLQQRALRFHLPEGTRQRYGVSTFRINDPVSELGAPWTPVAHRFRAGTLETCILTTCHSHWGTAFDLLNLGRSVFDNGACGHSNIFTISLVPCP